MIFTQGKKMCMQKRPGARLGVVVSSVLATGIVSTQLASANELPSYFQQAEPDTVIVVAQSDVAADIKLWRTTKSTDTYEAYRDYLERFPNGKFARLAKAKVKKLQPAEVAQPQQPASTEQPATTQQPVATQQPATTQQPVATQQPTTSEQQATTQQPASTQQQGANTAGSDATQPDQETAWQNANSAATLAAYESFIADCNDPCERRAQAERLVRSVKRGQKNFEKFLADDSLTVGKNGTALEEIELVEDLLPNEPWTLGARERIAERYGVLARAKLRSGSYNDARKLINRGQQVASTTELISLLSEVEQKESSSKARSNTSGSASSQSSTSQSSQPSTSSGSTASSSSGGGLKEWGVVFNDTFDGSQRTWVPPTGNGDATFRVKKRRMEIRNKASTSAWAGTHEIRKRSNSTGWSVVASFSMIARSDGQYNGLVLGNANEKYHFLITGDGAYIIQSYVNGKKQVLTNQQGVGAIKRFNRSRNVVRVDTNGAITRFFINDKQVYETSGYKTDMDRVGFRVSEQSTMRVNYIRVSSYQ